MFRATTSQAPRPNPLEISQGRFSTPRKALALAHNPRQAVPGLKLIMVLGGLAEP